MGAETLDTEAPPSYEAATRQAPHELVEPVSLVLNGRDIIVENTGDDTPLYQVSRSITALPPKNNSSSIHLHRVERGASEKTNGEPVTTHIFHLVHPVNADFRDDLPPYYVTATSPEALGNIILEANKHKLQRTEFSAKLSRDTNSAAKPLFHAKDKQQLVFDSKNRKGGQEWFDQHGKLLATECHNGQLPTLNMETPVPRNTRDALVAMWCMMLWYELAESRGAKRERNSRESDGAFRSNSWKECDEISRARTCDRTERRWKFLLNRRTDIGPGLGWNRGTALKHDGIGVF